VSDRGLPPDASPACPFLAFEDDRDARSTRPDHRHRCFAELRPAPRATAHQEAYCLSAGFATCPTFVDWARREAARPRTGAETPAAAAEAPAAAADAAVAGALLVEHTPEVAPAAADDVAIWPHRDARRDWAAPPPWTSGSATDQPAGGGPPGTGQPSSAARPPSESATPPPATPPPVAPVTPESGTARPPSTGAGSAADIAAPSFLATRSSEPPRPAGSLADASTKGSTSSERTRSAYPPPDLDDDADASLDDDRDWAEPESEEPAMRRFGPAAGRSRHESDAAHGTGKSPQPRRRPPPDPGAPSWEKPRRYEAYPTLRTRAGLSGASPVLIAGIVIVLGAVALFFIPPMLLGLGGGGGATPTPSGSGAVASATPDASPTPTPAPTPLIYVVKSGDTLSKIATQFDVTLDDLIAANKETLPNPDKLDIGDELIIPIGGLQPSPSPSPSPIEASPSP
jgi:hypothetical protein